MTMVEMKAQYRMYNRCIEQLKEAKGPTGKRLLKQYRALRLIVIQDIINHDTDSIEEL